jgi:hypothetical protein
MEITTTWSVIPPCSVGRAAAWEADAGGSEYVAAFVPGAHATRANQQPAAAVRRTTRSGELQGIGITTAEGG